MAASLRVTVLALFALSITTVAFAADAGEDPIPTDAATSDAESDAETPTDDVGPSSDVVDPEPDTTEPPSGQFSESECWDEMCPEQINACKADANCTSYAGCIVNSVDDAAVEACLTELQTTLGADPFQAASELYQKIAIDCGWSACATTEGSCAGDCGNYNGSDVCNCDSQCWDFGDCCQDICEVCSAENADECGTACVPNCDGKSCGDDSCGGSCGACMPGQSCEVDGTCAASCEDECTDGEVGCDGDSAWICGVNSLGCTAYSTIDCAGSGQVCSEGSCVDGAAGDVTGGDTAAGDVTGGDTAAGDVTGGDTAAGDTTDATGETSLSSPAGTSGRSAPTRPPCDTTVALGIRFPCPARSSRTASEEESGGGSASGCGGAPSDGGPLGGLIASLLVLGLAIRRRA